MFLGRHEFLTFPRSLRSQIGRWDGDEHFLLARWTLDKCQIRFACQFQKGCHNTIISYIFHKKLMISKSSLRKSIKKSLKDFTTTIFSNSSFLARKMKSKKNQDAHHLHRIKVLWNGHLANHPPTPTGYNAGQDSKSIRRLSEGEVGTLHQMGPGQIIATSPDLGPQMVV